MKKFTLLFTLVFIFLLSNSETLNAQTCSSSKCFGWAKLPDGYYGMPEKRNLFSVEIPTSITDLGGRPGLISVRGTNIMRYELIGAGFPYKYKVRIYLKPITYPSDLPWIKVLQARPYIAETNHGHFHFYIEGGDDSVIFHNN